MTKGTAKRRDKMELGDVVYIPIHSTTPDSKNGEGPYIPNSEDLVVVAQVIHYTAPYKIQIAVYKGLVKQSTISNLDLEKVLSSEVFVIYTTSSAAIKRGWWPFIKTCPIPKTMPFQAYYRVDDVLLDYSGDNKKSYLGYEHIKFLQEGISGTPGVVTLMVKDFYGMEVVVPTGYQDFIPNPEAVVWKIFPEAYSTPEEEQ